MSQIAVLKRAFERGEKLTARQIRGVYKIQSPAKVVSRLRLLAGVPVHFNKKTGLFELGKLRYDVIVKGYEATVGAPSAKVLAAGYRAVSAAK